MLKKAISQISFPREFSISRLLNLASTTGFNGIELRLSEKGEFSITSSEDEIHKIRKMAKELGLDVCSIVGGLQWKYPLSSPLNSVRETGIKAAKKAVKFASVLEAEVVLIVPAVVTKDLPYREAWKLALSSIVEIGKLAEQLGILIGVENVWNNFIFTPLEMLRFVEEANSMLNSDPIAVYFDVGNVIPFGYPEHWILCLKDYVRAVHVKDMKLLNRAAIAVLPPYGDVDWPSVMKALRSIGYKGYLTAEVSIPKLSLDIVLRYISSFMDSLIKMYASE